MASFAELQAAVYFHLGTTDRNAAFPRSEIKRSLNEAQDSLYEDATRANPDAFATTVTVTADVNDPTAYILGSQSPAITNVQLFTEVRARTNEGTVLREVPFSERYRSAGPVYAVVGQTSPTLYVAGITPGTLFLAYVPTIAALSADDDTPTWMPARFHDVLSLEAAQLAAGSGNEQTFSPTLALRLMDRKAQYLLAVGQRSLDPTLQRTR